LRLSTERANSVAEYLVGAGMPAEFVAVSGYGEYRPIDEGSDAAAKAANRRVEILLLN
jgi:chemotaxis protein MotB